MAALDGEEALRLIVEETVSETGMDFFRALVKRLASVLGTAGGWVTQYDPERRVLRTLAFWMDGGYIIDYEHPIDGTPCQVVIESKAVAHFPDRIIELYPNDHDLKALNAVSYLGIPLLDSDEEVLGHLAVLDNKPLPSSPRTLSFIRFFADRATAELRRLKAEQRVRLREEQLSRLLESAMDAIIEVDSELRVTMVNPAATRLFQCGKGECIGKDVGCFLACDDRKKLVSLVERMGCLPRGESSLWVPGELTVRRRDGTELPAEATFSRYSSQGRSFHSLILRNINEKRQAEEAIRSLTAETRYLRRELGALDSFSEIIGRSPALRQALRSVQQVAETDATVLILGETGTGKELFARAIHQSSCRHQAPLVNLNCAAIPATLIESELFGHEKGAFSGATSHRLGRFALADKGTIFLDEVTELPLELQGRLLRVLQEGELSPVGGSKSKKVDVRVLAATNRDIERLVKNGEFRADLFYRLNVFPIRIPPLRERREDVALLATAFAERFAKRMGRCLLPLSNEEIRHLASYSWPGNVRELRNVVERAVITAEDGRLNIARVLPEARGHVEEATAPVPAPEDTGRVLTAAEIAEIESANLTRALKACDGRIAGDGGAARLLQMNPSTLRSRIKALGLKRP